LNEALGVKKKKKKKKREREREREGYDNCTQIVESIFFPLCNEVFHLCLKKIK
jgi:hypothetical protein